MVKYLVIRNLKAAGEPPLGALFWDGTTVRAWGVCNRWPHADRQAPAIPFARRIFEGPQPLSLLLAQGSQSDDGWRVRNFRADDAEASAILAELDGYTYPPVPEPADR